MARVTVGQASSGVPLFPSDAFHSVNPNEGEIAYEETEQEEVCASGSGYREERKQHPDSTSGCVEGKSTTCGKATSQRGRIHALAASFFNNWRRDSSAPIDPVRTFSYSSPRRSSAHRAQTCVQQSLAHVSAPISPLFDEIHARTACNLAGVKFDFLWTINDKTLVCWTGPGNTCLAIDITEATADKIRQKHRLAVERYELEDSIA
jgi:hypothetical protein